MIMDDPTGSWMRMRFWDEGEDILDEGGDILDEGEDILDEGEDILDEGEDILDDGEEFESIVEELVECIGVVPATDFTNITVLSFSQNQNPLNSWR
jgi:hypothetical protein